MRSSIFAGPGVAALCFGCALAQAPLMLNVAAAEPLPYDVSCTPGEPASVPGCEEIPATACTSEGFQVTLIDFEIDQMAGSSVWTYEVCAGTTTCPLREGDLSHVDVLLPGLGTCIGEGQEVSFSAIDNSNGCVDPADGTATAECFAEHQDPSCDIDGIEGVDFVAKCEGFNDSLTDGECLQMELTIAGEQPTLGVGGVSTVSKTGSECSDTAKILGPSCGEPCFEPNGGGDQCLTRTRGFWGTHPAIAEAFLPVTVCGEDIEATDANTCASTSQALCTNAPDRRSNPTSLTLVAQITAAKLNLNATDFTTNGACLEWDYEGMDIYAWLDFCELTGSAGGDGFCDDNKKAISESGCIEALDDFNNSVDVLDQTPAPFDRPGPADVAECQLARGDGTSLYDCAP